MDHEKDLPVPAVDSTDLVKDGEPEHPWLSLSDKAKKGLDVAKKAQKTKHGLFANIPIICQADECPYTETCPAYHADLAPIGEPCIVEIALIMKLFDEYTKELGIDTTQVVNLGLVKTVIDSDIEISRCEAILAKDANILPQRIVAVTQTGMKVTQPDVHPAILIKEKAVARRNAALQLLNSTPKDKAKKDGTIIIDPSTYASQILKKYKQQQKKEQEGEIIDVTPKKQDSDEDLSSAD